jgi:hypothetical protein
MHTVPDEDLRALLVENTRLEAQLDGLQRALQSRATIEQAKGVLATVTQCTEANAFDLLVELSQRRNVRLRVVAEALLRMVASGFESADTDGLQQWLREELIRLGTRRGRPRH